MTKPSKKVAAALVAYGAAYRKCYTGKVANMDVAVAYVIADMFNQNKHSPENTAVLTIEDETAYLLEKKC